MFVLVIRKRVRMYPLCLPRERAAKEKSLFFFFLGVCVCVEFSQVCVLERDKREREFRGRRRRWGCEKQPQQGHAKHKLES
jgi:hypothetical protein